MPAVKSNIYRSSNKYTDIDCVFVLNIVPIDFDEVMSSPNVPIFDISTPSINTTQARTSKQSRIDTTSKQRKSIPLSVLRGLTNELLAINKSTNTSMIQSINQTPTTINQPVHFIESPEQLAQVVDTPTTVKQSKYTTPSLSKPGRKTTPPDIVIATPYRPPGGISTNITPPTT